MLNFEISRKTSTILIRLSVRPEHVALPDRQHLHPVPLHLRSLRPHHWVRQPYRHLGGHLEEVPLTPFLHLVSSRKSLLHPHFNFSGTSTTLLPLFTGLALCSSSAAPSSSPTFQSSWGRTRRRRPPSGNSLLVLVKRALNLGGRTFSSQLRPRPLVKYKNNPRLLSLWLWESSTVLLIKLTISHKKFM